MLYKSLLQPKKGLTMPCFDDIIPYTTVRLRHPVDKQNQGIQARLRFYFCAMKRMRLLCAGAFFEGDQMYGIKTTAAFDSAHFLKGYSGKCANIHGHRWVIEAEAESTELLQSGEKRGMVMDFSDFKKALKALADEFDHALIIEINSLKENTLSALKDESFKIIEVPFRPTAENFARYFFEELRRKKIPVSCVAVYETPQNCAYYKEEA